MVHNQNKWVFRIKIYMRSIHKIEKSEAKIYEIDIMDI